MSEVGNITVYEPARQVERVQPDQGSIIFSRLVNPVANECKNFC